jgi:hypothetical protein
MEDKKLPRSYYSLSIVVDDWIDDNTLSSSWFPKGLKWAIRGLKRIRMDIHQQPKTEILTVTERKTITCPEGFVDWVKVAVKKGQYAITLSVNDDMTINTRTTTDTTVRALLSQNMPNGTDMSAYGGYEFLNYTGGNIFGIGPGLPSKGFFKVVDRGATKEILLDYDYNFSQVYLEYITDGIDTCGETFVHPYEYEFLIAFMDMMYEKKNNPKATLGSKREAELDVDAEERKLRGRYNDLSPQDILNISRNEARLTTKL